MFKRHYEKRSPNIPFVIFRLCLSMVIFAVLLGGIYSAYKHFSGIDPLKIDPQTWVLNLIKSKIPLSNLGVLGVKKSEPVSVPASLIPEQKSVNLSFLLISDSHFENNYLNKAIIQAKEKTDLKFIIGLGDYTEVGTTGELTDLKKVLDQSALRYFLAPGDHDLWDSRDKNLPAETNFNKIFGPAYQSFVFDNIRFILINNADNYLGLSDAQFAWIESELERAKQEGNSAVYVFMHEPLYHPSSDHVMGIVENNLKLQAKSLSFILKEGGVKEVFFGHVHFFSRYKDPVSDLPMTVVGGLTTQSNAQAPRYAVVNVYTDGSLGVEDIEVK